MGRKLLSVIASLMFVAAPLGQRALVVGAQPASSASAVAGVASSVLVQATQVEAGDTHTCALTGGGGVKCWGDNQFGQLGDGTTTIRFAPVDVTGLGSGVTAIAVGFNHTCALMTGGEVKCWGDNRLGQLGDGTTINRYTPISVTGLGGSVTKMAGGWLHTCVVTASGGAKCWGYNGYGQLGDGTRTSRLTPVNVTGLGSGVTAIAANSLHTCAVTVGGGVKCWGVNWHGQLGNGTTADSYVPVAVTGLGSGVTAITTGNDHTCAASTGGGIKCWGDNRDGQLGDGTTSDKYTPVDVTGLGSGVSEIEAGYIHTCALTIGGGVKCWGSNGWGQLGDGTTTDRYAPFGVTGLASGATAVAAGHYHTCALTTGGGVKCWGVNNSGQLGDGTTITSLTPVNVFGFEGCSRDQQNQTDSDGDGLLDVWEACGYDADGDGVIDVNLPALGANPLRKDIFVEIDYMEDLAPCIVGSCTVGHTHRPKKEAIDLVVQAFARAPVTNPNGSPGIALHVLIDQAMPERAVLGDSQRLWTVALDQIKYDQGYFNPKRRAIFHYALFAHDISIQTVGMSGIDRTGTSDIIVSLGQYRGTVNQQAGTLMHELGHNLGLNHGGDDGVNNKPNYLSVMNYAFQMSGLRYDHTDGLLDYSRFSSIPALNEESLDERVGLNGGAAISGYGTRVPCIQIPNTDVILFWAVDNANGPINWDCDLLGRTDGVGIKANINADHVNGVARYTILTGFDDWAFVKLGGGAIGKKQLASPIRGAASDVDIPLDELTANEDARIVRPHYVALQGGGPVIASLAVSSTSFITVSNLGALTTTIVFSHSSGPSWFNLGAMPVSVTLVPSAYLSIPVTLTVPTTRSSQITSSVSIWASPSESPQMGDVATLYTVIGPFARYEAMPMRGVGPFTVTFSDASIGQIASRLWNFGDGVTSTVVSPTHFYAMPGIYTATLTVTGPDGVDVTSGASPIEMVIL